MTLDEMDELLPLVAREVEPYQDERSRDDARGHAECGEQQDALEFYLDDAAQAGVRLSPAVLARVREFVARPPAPFMLDMHAALARLEAAQ